MAARKKPIRCTALSLAHLRAQGYLCDVVEKRIPGCMITKDLFGFVDILAVRRGEILGVQTTSSSNMASRIAKIAEHENVGQVRESGMRLVVHGWKKRADGQHQLREADVS
jgi:predicted metalloprotease